MEQLEIQALPATPREAGSYARSPAKGLKKGHWPISANPSSMIRTVYVLRSFSAPPHSLALFTDIDCLIKASISSQENSRTAKILTRFNYADKLGRRKSSVLLIRPIE
jgi:hypothetical protein